METGSKKLIILSRITIEIFITVNTIRTLITNCNAVVYSTVSQSNTSLRIFSLIYPPPYPMGADLSIQDYHYVVFGHKEITNNCIINRY